MRVAGLFLLIIVLANYESFANQQFCLCKESLGVGDGLFGNLGTT